MSDCWLDQEPALARSYEEPFAIEDHDASRHDARWDRQPNLNRLVGGAQTADQCAHDVEREKRR
ncbi:MAG: hypothetical protein J2P54_15300, partial [Bradyrhizobiaceae bacterium]|nr:hypothetical protein [Bradyrhizobiaceae bacterium]